MKSGTTWRVPSRPRHNRWDPTVPPVVEVPSNAVLALQTISADDGQIDREDPSPDFDRDRIHPLTGPIAIEGAQPGDALRVDILSIVPATWGWQLVTDDRGFLRHTGMRDEVIVCALDVTSQVARYPSGTLVPMRPMLGIVGVAPDTKVPLRTIEPGVFGGNLDIAELTVGSTIWLPVQVPGALLSIGDVHAAQGDGEVCLTGIETGADVVVRVTLESDLLLDRPRFETPGGLGVTGFGRETDIALRDSLEAAIDLLVTHGLSREEAYAICSACGDLRLSQVVNGEVRGSHLLLPHETIRSLPG